MDEHEKVLIFDLVGKFAHFRKFYTNSSSLSYHLPPRTTLEGIIAAMMGLDRDSYYDLFLPSKSLIAVSPRTRTRGIMQTINYLSVKNAGDLSGRDRRTQVPFEIVVSENANEDLRYRVYFHHRDLDMVRRVEERIRRAIFHYPISLGPANFLCQVDFVAWGDMSEFIDTRNANDSVNVFSPIPIDAMRHFDILSGREVQHKFVRDTFPFHFGDQRTPGRNVKLIYSKDFSPVEITTPFGSRLIRYSDHGFPVTEGIVFSEDWIPDN